MRRYIFLFGVLSLFVVGCSNTINDVVDPIGTNNSAIEKPDWVRAAELQGYEFVYLPEFQQNTLNKISSTTKLAKFNVNTNIGLNFNYVTSNARNVSVKCDLTIPAYALNESEYITLTLNDSTILTDVDLTFGPHGTNFNTPALLNIDAKGLDLSAYPKGTIFQLAYFNQASGLWEIMKADQISVNINSGSLKLVNGKLPHFSRYGFIRKGETLIQNSSYLTLE